MPSTTRTTVAVGPVMSGWGSWDWIGVFLVEHLGRHYPVTTFGAWEVPNADVVVVVKHAPPTDWVEEVARRASLIYCPIDHYGAAAEIDADSGWLRKCARILVHRRRLQPHFAPLAPTSYIDHPLKFTLPIRKTFRPAGPLLWVGVWSNLQPLVEWVNAHPLPAPLDVLTNPEAQGRVPAATDLGFDPTRDVRVLEWTPERHLRFAAIARAALDVKGDDFRARHKPPAKALDFVASGLPLAMNPGTSSAEHLAALGLKVPAPLDTGAWLSEKYWKETRHQGEKFGRELSPERVANRFRKVIEEALANRPERIAVPSPAPARHAGIRAPDVVADYRAAECGGNSRRVRDRNLCARRLGRSRYARSASSMSSTRSGCTVGSGADRMAQVDRLVRVGVAYELVAVETPSRFPAGVAGPQFGDRQTVEQSEQLGRSVLTTVVRVGGARDEPVGGGQEHGVGRHPQERLDEPAVVLDVLE